MDGCWRECTPAGSIRQPAPLIEARSCADGDASVASHAASRALGYVFDSSAGCWTPGGNLRGPDITFVSHARLPRGVTEGFLRLAAPRPRPGGEHLAAGAGMVWVIHPAARSAVSCRSLTSVRVVHEGDDLDGEDVVPGFPCPLADVLG